MTDSLTFNPRVRLDSPGREEGPCLQVQWPDPARGLQTVTVRADDEAELYALLREVRAAADRGAGMDLDIDEHVWERLCDLNVLVEPEKVVPEVRFRCELPEVAGELPAAAAVGDLVMNPTARVIDAAAELGAGAAAVLAEGPFVTFVAPTGLRDYLWLDADATAAVRGLIVGRLTAADLRADLRLRLRASGLLLARGTAVADSDARFAAACEHFRARDFAVLGGLVPPHRRAALHDYYVALVRHGYATLGDSLSERRYALHREILANSFHGDLAGLVTRVSGGAMKPSYNYFASYLPGSCVPRHKDREQSELALLIAVDATSIPGGSTWPFHLADEQGETSTILLDPGDALLFRGRRLAHWREALPEGASWDSLLLFFVPEDFTGSLD